MKMIASKMPSQERQEWLERKENAFKLRRVMRENGGHIMLKNFAIDPNELEEPLRTEAIK